jgi:hypothetical protein
LRVVAPHERLLEHQAQALGGVEGTLDVCGAAAHRLLAQHVLAGLQRPDRPLDVQRVGQRVVDRFDLGVGEQVLVGPVCARQPALGDEGLRALEVARADGHELLIVAAAEELVGDVRGGEDPPAQAQAVLLSRIG